MPPAMLALLGEAMSITSVAVLALKAKAVEFIIQATKDFIQETIPNLAKEYETQLNEKLAMIAPGDDFLGLPVVYVEEDYFFPLLRFENISIVSGLKVELIRGTLKVERHVNLTDSSNPPIKIDSIPAYAFYISLEQPNYGLAIGGGEDQLLKFKQMRVAVRWDAVPLRLQGYYAEAEHGGFVITVRTDLPFPIPLANTGFGLCGVGLAYGERFAPRLTERVDADPIEEMRKATAQDFVNWARKRPEEQWVPAKVDVRLFGLNTDIGDISTAGHIVRFEEVGLTYLSYGPTIILGGRLVGLNTLRLGDSIGAIHVPSQSVFLSNSISVPIADLLDIYGRVEYSASLHDQNKTWVAVGGYEMNAARLKILNLLELWGGIRLVPLQGFAMRAGARLKGEGELLGFGGGFSFAIEVMGSIGWNPVELGGQLSVEGYVWIKIFGRELGIGAGATLRLHLPKPLELNFSVTITFKIWFKKFSKTITIFNLDDKRILAAAEALGLAHGVPISFIHRASGVTGVINSTDNPNNEVLPDVSFDLPFQRIAGGVTGATNAAPGDGAHREGGIDVVHQISKLKIYKIDEKGNEIDVPGIRAAWLGMADGDLHRRSSRLAIPCADPFAWLQSFEYASPCSTQPRLDTIFQTFGAGPNETISSTGIQPAIFNLGCLRLSHPKIIHIRNLHRIAPYERTVIAIEIELSANVGPHAPNEMLSVRGYDLRFVGRSGREPRISVTNGTIAFSKVRELGNERAEWAGNVVRTLAEQKLPLSIVSTDEWPFALAAVGYAIDWSEDIRGAEETVLEPGVYKLYVDGTTTTAFRGGSGPQTIWKGLAEQFRVIPPKDLRPYLRYATNGDERIFGVSYPGWNPNPFGVGFGHYQSHLGVARSRVGYLSKIFPTVWVSPSRDIMPVEVKVTPCTDGTIAGSRLSQEWQTTFNGPQLLEEEFSYEIPTEAGVHEMTVWALRDKSGEPEAVDEWSYRVSRFDLPRQHLWPRHEMLVRAYGPYGTTGVVSKTINISPADLSGAADAELESGWALPPWIQRETGFGVDAGLTFLRIAEWIGAFRADPPVYNERLIVPSKTTELCLLADHDQRPVALLWRTPEPVDWRRVELEVFQGVNSFGRRFTTRMTPSPDGTSCVVTLLAEGVAVRIPAGALALKLKFHYVKNGLATLVDRHDANSKSDEMLLAFTQPLGSIWPVW